VPTIARRREWARAALLAGVVLSAACARGPAPPDTSALGAIDPAVKALVDELTAGVNADRGDVTRLGRLAMAYEANGLLVQAAQAYDVAVRLDEREPRWRYRRALLAARRGEVDAALADLEQVITQAPGYAPARWRKGLWLLDRGRAEEAAISFREAMKAAPADAAGPIGLALVHLSKREDAEAVAELERLIERSPGDRYALHLLGTAYQRLGRSDEARFALSIGRGGQPLWADTWSDEVAQYRRGFAAMLKEATQLGLERRFDEAIAILERLRKERPDDTALRVYLGGMYASAGRLPEATALLETVLAADPRQFDATMHLASGHLFAGALDKALNTPRAPGAPPESADAAKLRESGLAAGTRARGPWRASTRRHRRIPRSDASPLDGHDSRPAGTVPPGAEPVRGRPVEESTTRRRADRRRRHLRRDRRFRPGAKGTRARRAGRAYEPAARRGSRAHRRGRQEREMTMTGQVSITTSLCALCLAAACGSPSSERGSVPAPPPTAGPVWFEDVAASRGLDFTHKSGHETRYLLPEIMGGGAALFDMENDGDLDLLMVQSGRLSAPAGTPAGHRLYRNRGDGSFEDVSADHGVAAVPGYGMGVATGDYDNDGDVDLYITGFGSNVLLQNDGRGRFTDVTRAAGAAASGWSTSATFVDVDADGRLDLFVARYLDWATDRERECFSLTGQVDYCAPKNYDAPTADVLFRNNGNGTFTDVSKSSGLGTAVGNGLGVVADDVNGDGRVDIFVANDATPNHLWINRGDARFEETAMMAGVAIDQDGAPKAGMGVHAADVDEDGDNDLIVMNLDTESDSFFRNEGAAWRRHEVGLRVVSRRFTRFGVAILDFDNDGRLDLC
jgi:tetratricopeptide (TPR) repeat protein